ncbi:MAG: endopeptidase La [Bacteroidota bacterium]
MHFNDSFPFTPSFIPGFVVERPDRSLQLVISEEDEHVINDSGQTTFPLLPTKDSVLFPGTVVPLHLKHSQYTKLAQKCCEKGKLIGVVAQKRSNVDDPKGKDIFQIGTIAKVIEVVDFSEGHAAVIAQGRYRFQIDEILTESPRLSAQVHRLESKILDVSRKKVKALMQSLKEAAGSILSITSESPTEILALLESIHDLDFLTYFLSANISVDVRRKQQLLALNDGVKRANLLLKYLLKTLEFTQLKQEIQNKVHTDINQIQRDQYIRHHIRILQEELGDGEGEELEELRTKGKKKMWSKEVATLFNKALDKAERLSPYNPDYSNLINHAELLLELPWKTYTKDNLNLQQAERVLNKDHFGLEKVKERILEYLAVRKLKQDMKGPILCLHGPPGVGKTSLCRSIAKALNRKYARISLGGLHDEAEIRGHRKTYVSAMPGKIICSIQKCASANPVIALDEVDKLGGMRGDPAAALLEVLDPEQNNTFVDNFLEVPFDLSKVLFITTANALDTIPLPLKDRMEIIELNGYTVEEKIQIAKKYLFPKQRKAHGLKASDIRINDKAIAKIAESYTRESGVRELERQIGSITRKIAKSVALEECHPRNITPDEVSQLLGLEPFDQETYQNITLPGVAIGLAWTPVGGEILFVEATLSRGKGKLILSGQLGDVMKESATTALSYLKAHADDLAINYHIFDQYDLHVHVPAGAVPKDGPSAGITLSAALASLYTQRKLKNRLAMTGEVTLRGKVLPVGGIKEKILAAKRVGISDIILSKQNKKDIHDIQAQYISGLTFHYVDHVQEVLQQALEPRKVPNARVWKVIKERQVSRRTYPTD